MTTAPALRLYLDLGDAFTKAAAEGHVERERVRFPSVVAKRLVEREQDLEQLLLDPRDGVLRPLDFDARAHPRTRSYQGADSFVKMVSSRPPPAGARFAGGIAAVYGADRQMLGAHATDENVEALVHKALMLVCAAARSDAELVFVVDTGEKVAAISRYVGALPRAVELALRSYRRPGPRRIDVQLRAAPRPIVDAADCVLAALPEAGLPRGRRTLLVDVGHFRTKLTLASPEGCEHQEQLDLGMADCVRRVLRDCQEQGLVEDEFAVVRALEEARGPLVTFGERRFDVGAALGSARVTLEEELAKAVRRVVLDSYGRRGESCHAVAIVGGGAAVVGRGLAERLDAPGIGLGAVWITPDPSFFAVEGARKIYGATSR